MPNLKLTLQVDDKGATSKVKAFGGAVDAMKRKAQAAGAKVQGAFRGMGRGVQALGQKLQRFKSIGVAALTAFAVASVVTGAKFDASMRNVQAITGATDATFRKLAATARHLGETTAFSASQAADAMTALAQAGQNTAQIQKTVGQVLLFAGSAGIGLGEAAEQLVQTMAQFGVAAENSGRVVNTMAASFGTSLLNAERLREGMSQVGSTAAALGVSLEQTTGVLGLLNSAGQLGAVAGTRLKNVFIRLAAPNQVLKELLGGVAFNGENLGEVMDALAKNTKDTGKIFQAFGRIAGPAVLTLMKEGSANIERMTKSVTGTNKAGEMFETQMKATTKVFAIFKSAVQEDMIAIFEALRPQINGVLGALTDGVKAAKPVIVGLVVTTSRWVRENKETLIIMAKVAGAVAAVAAVVVGWKIILIGAIIAVIFNLIKYRDKVAEVAGVVRDKFLAMFETIKEWGAKVFDVIKKPFKFLADLATKAAGIFARVFPGAADAVGNLVDLVKEKAGDSIEFVVRGGEAAAGAVKDTTKKVVAFVGDTWEAAAAKAKDTAAAIVEAGRTASSNATGPTTEERTVKAKAGPSPGGIAFPGIEIGIAAAYDKGFQRAVSLQEAAQEQMALDAKVRIREVLAQDKRWTEEWLAARQAMIREKAQAEIIEAGADAVKVAELQIQAAADVAAARAEYEQAYVDKFLEDQVLIRSELEALSATYDDVTQAAIDGELKKFQVGKSLMENFRRSFIKNTASMLKFWIGQQLRALLIVQTAKEKDALHEKYLAAKTGAVKAYSAFASIPIIGPALGAAAAAAAFAFLIAFHRGGLVGGAGAGDEVPAVLKRDEFVIREQSVRSVGPSTLDYINRTGQIPAGGGGGGNLEAHFHLPATGKSKSQLIDEIQETVVPILEDLAGQGRLNFVLRTS